MNPRKQARWAAVATGAAAIATAVGLTVAGAFGGNPAGAAASGQSYPVPCPAADQVTPAFNSNLIANPGAEDVTSLTALGAPSGDTANVADCWTAGNATQAAPAPVVEVNSYASYATASADPSKGQNFFWGGTQSATASVTDYATQLVSLGSLKAAGQPFALSAYLGGFTTQSDNMGVTATFEDAGGATLGAASIGPVTAAQRGSITQLVQQAWYGTVPVNTAQVLITLTQTGTGTTLDGSADDVNLTIGASAIPSSPVLQKLPYAATGTDGGLGLPAGVSAANGAVYASNTRDNVLAVLDAGNTSAIAGSLEGYGENGDEQTAIAATLYQPAGTAEDANGDIYIADSGDNVVREITPDGLIHQVTNGYLDHPTDVAIDSGGNLFISDTYDDQIVEVEHDGTIERAIGIGKAGYSGDGGKAYNARLNQPTGLAFDAQGNLYIADSGNNVIRRLDASTGIITTVAGDFAADQANDGLGGFSGDGGPATGAQLNDPQGVAVDGAGDLFIADTFNSVIREVTPAGVISTVAGVIGANGAAAPGSETSGAAPTASHLSGPQAVAVDLSTGTLYIADTHNSAIAEVFDVAQSGSAAGPVAPSAKS